MMGLPQFTMAFKICTKSWSNDLDDLGVPPNLGNLHIMVSWLSDTKWAFLSVPVGAGLRLL